MVGHAGSPTRRPTMHVDMTLTGSKFKVKVIHLLNFRKLHFSTSTSSTICALRSKVMGDFDSTGPSLYSFSGPVFLILPQLPVT